MKIKFTDAYAKRAGEETEVGDAAARRLIDKGWAEEAGAKTEAKADDKPAKKAAKAPAKKAVAKS